MYQHLTRKLLGLTTITQKKGRNLGRGPGNPALHTLLSASSLENDNGCRNEERSSDNVKKYHSYSNEWKWRASRHFLILYRCTPCHVWNIDCGAVLILATLDTWTVMALRSTVLLTCVLSLPEDSNWEEQFHFPYPYKYLSKWINLSCPLGKHQKYLWFQKQPAVNMSYANLTSNLTWH